MTSSWQYKAETPDERGAQIDLVIDRADRVVTLCEIKFADQPYTINKAYATILREKIATFKRATRTKKSVFLAMVTPYGVVPNPHATQLVHSQSTLDDLFVSALA